MVPYYNLLIVIAQGLNLHKLIFALQQRLFHHSLLAFLIGFGLLLP